MASLTIRNLNPDIKAKLRIRAAEHGRSMEAEAREILTRLLTPSPVEKLHLVDRIRKRVAEFGGVELPETPDQAVPDPPDSQGPERGR